MSKLEEIKSHVLFASVFLIPGCGAFSFAAYRDPIATVGGFGLGAMICGIGLIWLDGLAILKGEQREEPAEAETQTAHKETVGEYAPAYSSQVPTILNPNEVWLSIEPGVGIKLKATREAVETLRGLVANGKQNVAVRDFIGKDKVYHYSMEDFKAFQEELIARGLAVLTQAKTVRLNKYGLQVFSNPSPVVG